MSCALALSRRTLVAATAAIAVVLGTAFVTVTGSTAREPVQPGKPAPDFTAKDSAGKEVRLSALKGRIVVLEWNNPDCPYVKKHYNAGNMQSVQAEAQAKGAVWLTINSGPPGAQGHMNGLEADKYVADRKSVAAHYLLDPDGKVGRAFGATVTPHMFVIDKAGNVAYMGGIDDKPSTNVGDIKDARNFVREAVAAVAEGKPVQTASARPYGCQIKYNEPRS